jgi:hypothetical protein
MIGPFRNANAAARSTKQRKSHRERLRPPISEGAELREIAELLIAAAHQLRNRKRKISGRAAPPTSMPPPHAE